MRRPPAAAEIAALRARVVELEGLEGARKERDRIEAALLKIAEAATAVRDMPEFYASIVEELVEVEGAGELELKGFSRPMPAYLAQRWAGNTR